MNVLGLRGPQFLVLYAALSMLTIGLVWIGIRWREEARDFGAARVRDPYEIAYLRGGIGELVKVAVLSLVRRGFLEPVADTVRTTGAGAAADAPDNSSAVDGVILRLCATPRTAAALAQFGVVKAAAAPLHRALIDKQLMPTPAMRRARAVIAGAAQLFLGGVAASKIVRALSEGRWNVGLLLILAAVSFVVLVKIANFPRTGAGNRTLEQLHALFLRVKNGPRPVATVALHEAMLLAAVYGDYATPDPAAWRRLFPNPGKGGRADGGGCGSSCGGGGCGGGCGGCGS